MGALIIRVTWKPYSMYKSRCMSSPLLMCKLPWGHQETKAQPMPKYISQALSFDSAETRRTRGKSKIRNETPIPKVTVSKKLTTMKNGSCWPGEGSILTGCQIALPTRKAGIVTSRVTANTLTQVLRMPRAPLGASADTFDMYVLLSIRAG